MFINDDILQELRAIGPALVPLQNINVYSVPEHYFDAFSEAVLMEINHAELSVLPSGEFKKMEVPAGYFDQLAENILLKIKSSSIQTAAEELKELSPALNATGNDNVFAAPRGYFENLPEIILSQVNKPAKVIVMKQRSSFAKYAAAAVITGLMGLTLFSVFDDKNIEQSSSLTASVNDVSNQASLSDFDKALKTVTADEIVGYLQNNGLDVKAALVASAIDSKELPAPDAYIINENTLNNFLDELNVNDYTN